MAGRKRNVVFLLPKARARKRRKKALPKKPEHCPDVKGFWRDRIIEEYLRWHEQTGGHPDWEKDFSQAPILHWYRAHTGALAAKRSHSDGYYLNTKSLTPKRLTRLKRVWKA